MNTKKYQPDGIKSYVSSILEGYGVSANKAQVTSKVLIEADLRGIFSHGINQLDVMIIPSIVSGGIDPNAVAEDKTRNKNYPIRHINAHGDLGYPVAMDAVNIVKNLARKQGYGKVYVFNANHFGAGAVYSEAICQERDLEGRIMCTTSSVVEPYGGRKNRLGTNLISWSIPYDKGIITIDMATTIHAANSIIKAFVEGTQLPFPVYDKNGNETTNPHAFKDVIDFLCNGSMVPLGGIGKGHADVGYKGTGLAMLIELDNVIGGGQSEFVSSVEFDEKRWIRQSFEAWRIDTLFSSEEALQHISSTVKNIREEQGKKMLLPGEKEVRQREISLREGILYSPKQIARLEKLGQSIALGNVS
jgi:LDH2 family malate/lactate/ureidoglycolate dehydrogenase